MNRIIEAQLQPVANVGLDRNSRHRRNGPVETRPPSPSTRGEQQVFRSGEVLQIIGISRRQLQYWAQTKLVVPSKSTSGGHRRYSFEDLISLKATKRLRDAGVSVQRIRKSIGGLRRMLPKVEHPLSELTLVATGDVLLVFRDGTAFDAISGQEWVLEIAQFQREIEAWRDHGVAKSQAGEPRTERQDDEAVIA